MEGKEREAGFELLRITAMYMVVVLHYLDRTAAQTGSLAVLQTVLESLCIPAVNVFVLISGYFLSAAAFSWRRPVRIIAQTLFYSILIPIVLAVLGAVSFSEVFGIYHIWSSVFPVQSGQYWFVTAYVVMACFSPLLNAALERMDRKDLRGMLAALILFFCVGKSLSPIRFASDRYGYDFGWFLVLYLIGGYIRRYGAGPVRSARAGWTLYLCSAAGTAVLETVLQRIGGGLTYFASVPYHYNFLLCLTGALGLFCAFSHMHIREGKTAALIRRISPAMLGVYLIHAQEDLADRWFPWMNMLTGKLGEGFSQAMADGACVTPASRYLAVLILQVTLVFAFCAAIDLVRGALVRAVRRRKKGS